MHRRLSALLFLLFFIFHNGKAQSDLQKLINSARGIKQKGPAKNNVKSQLPPGTNNSWRVSVTLSRSLAEASDVISSGGCPIMAHFKNERESIVSIPFDKNNNHLADAWEKGLGIFDKGYSPEWDDEAETGNKHNGDGITLYEEYRGVVARDKFKRLDPKKKELFIINKIGPLIRPGLRLLERAADIKVVELSSSEIRDDKIVNFNSKAFHGGDQTAIRCVKHSFLEPDATDKQNGAKSNLVMGLLEAKTMIDGSPVVRSPKDAIEYRVNEERLGEALHLLKNVPHELAHGCGVKHHGADVELKWKIAKHFAVGHDEMVVVDMNGNNILNTIFQPADDDDIAETNGAATGNVRCLMTYDDDYEYIMAKKVIGVETTKYTFTITPYRVKKRTDSKKEFLQTIFCTNQTGTEWNGNGKLSGDAANGNCLSQFQIRDW